MKLLTVNKTDVFMIDGEDCKFDRQIDGSLLVTCWGREFMYSPGSWSYEFERMTSSPHSSEIEQVVIGTMLLYPDLAVTAFVDSEDFYIPAHQAYVETAKKLGVTEAKLVVDSLRQGGDLDKSGGMAYFGILLDRAVRPDEINGFIDALKSYSKRREALVRAEELTKAAIEGNIDRIHELCG